jgi:uncharacterized Fe-S cluster protein YjdI
VKNIKYFTCGQNTIEWSQERCMHSGKCLEEITIENKSIGMFNIDVPSQQFELLLNKVTYCPSHALQILESK